MFFLIGIFFNLVFIFGILSFLYNSNLNPKEPFGVVLSPSFFEPEIPFFPIEHFIL